jgi:CBS domain-containing protein
MPRTVQDIMNRELLTVRPDLPLGEATELLLSFRVGAAPVLDDTGRLVGVVALRDLVGEGRPGSSVRERMSRPAISVSVSATVEQVARQLASMDMHHLVVVDGAGTAVGMLSTLDALRALLDLPARHPQTFPHWDESTEVSWTDEWPVDVHAAPRAPAGTGVLVLVTGRLGEMDVVAWVESASSLQERVRNLATSPDTEEPTLLRALATPGVRFRAAAVADEAARERIVKVLRQRIEKRPAPGAT